MASEDNSPAGRSTQTSGTFCGLSGAWRKTRLVELLKSRMQILIVRGDTLEAELLHPILSRDVGALLRAELVAVRAEQQSFAVMVSLAENI